MTFKEMILEFWYNISTSKYRDGEYWRNNETSERINRDRNGEVY